MSERFGKTEKLKSKIAIEQLFAEGLSIKKYPLRLVYLPVNDPSRVHKTAVSVPKRNFKTAVARNKLKRLMREAFRKNKYLVTSELAGAYNLMFIYTGRQMEEYSRVFSAMEELLKSLVQKEKKIEDG